MGALKSTIRNTHTTNVFFSPLHTVLLLEDKAAPAEMEFCHLIKKRILGKNRQIPCLDL